MSERVHITEVGPRDGLQNESTWIPTDVKVAFVEALVAAGAQAIECASFVHPEKVPAMADAAEVFAALERRPGVRYIATAPNLKGYARAREAGCDAVAIFTAASDGFSRANVGMSVAESVAGFDPVAAAAAQDGITLRGYVSTIFACPYDGEVAPEVVRDVALQLLELGCYEVSLGDTTGVGTPAETGRLLDVVLREVPVDRVAMHFHDTWGMAVANAIESLRYGVRRFDASAGGLGGCPFAMSATGNLATEDLIYALDRLGYESGLSLDAVASAAEMIGSRIDRPLPSRVHQALASGRKG